MLSFSIVSTHLRLLALSTCKVFDCHYLPSPLPPTTFLKSVLSPSQYDRHFIYFLLPSSTTTTDSVLLLLDNHDSAGPLSRVQSLNSACMAGFTQPYDVSFPLSLAFHNFPALSSSTMTVRWPHCHPPLAPSTRPSTSAP